MIKNNEKLNEFIKSFMDQFGPNYGFQLSDGFTPHHIARAITGHFTDVRMNNDDLEDLVTVGFAIALSATKGLEGEKFTEDKLKERFEFFIEMAMN